MRLSTTATLVLVLMTTITHAQAWDVNDVSILLPLPATTNSAGILLPSTQGQGGELLPEKYLAMLPPLTRQISASSQLAVVGVRIDPCFPGVSTDAEPCHYQIRMMWQPLVANGDTMSALDAAVHTFYELTPDEFRAMTAKIAALNTSSGAATVGLPLQTHPVIASQGLGGAYWQQLRAIFLSYAGEARFVRFTFMTVETANTMWDFGGFDVVGGKVTRMVIPRIETRLQSFINSGTGDEAFRGGAKPPALGDVDTFNRITDKSSTLTPTDTTVLRASVDSAYRVENPKLNSPSTIDCASCHSAQPARLWAESQFPDLGLDQSQYRFESPYNLTNVTARATDTHLMRSFGYDGTRPAINQRVINESAAVADALSRQNGEPAKRVAPPF